MFKYLNFNLTVLKPLLVFFTIRVDGVMEVWDLLFQHKVPICPVMVADYPLHAIKVLNILYKMVADYPLHAIKVLIVLYEMVADYPLHAIKVCTAQGPNLSGHGGGLPTPCYQGIVLYKMVVDYPLHAIKVSTAHCTRS